MALALLTTTAFEKDLRRAEKQGKDRDKLEAIVNLLQAQEDLPGALPGAPAARRLVRALGLPCGPDWVLLYRVTSEELILIRTGSHREPFGR